MKQKFIIIGISDSRKQDFSRTIHEIISEGIVFSGGKRHHDIMKEYLPKDYEWIDITVPLDDVFRQYEGCEEVIVFASGDPLFFGFANTVRNRLPDAEIIVYPYFNSIQMLAHRLLIPYSEARIVSLTGREWKKFDAALINGEEMIGLLTDRVKTPVTIARHMIDYGYDNYIMHIGEMLGNDMEERCRTMSVREAANLNDLKHPNAIILERTKERYHEFGIPEKKFDLLDGRESMITKMPIRLLTISLLELENKSSFWDIGFCTGSVSIETRLHYPGIDITSFEIRERCMGIIESNARKFGAPGIMAVTGDFMEIPLDSYKTPDAVFIGGHGGRLAEMIERIAPLLAKNGVIVFNSVTDKSHQMFLEGVIRAGLKMEGETRITIDTHNPIRILKARK